MTESETFVEYLKLILCDSTVKTLYSQNYCINAYTS